MQTITPFLWFEKDAEQAVKFYTSIFKNSKIHSLNTLPGGIVTGEFELNNQKFMVLQGGPNQFKFNDSISFFVNVDTQEEVNYYWETLTANGGEESMCGWLKDKYGVSWQIIPKALPELMNDPDPAKSQRVMEAMLQMKKIIVANLQKAHQG